MFSKKHPVLFISKHFIDPGYVTVGRQVSFDGFEALAYAEETLPDVLRQIQALFRKSIRVVLSEELAYVTEISFPAGTSVTRDLVRRAVEEAAPEDLRATAWDFQTLRYAKKQESGTGILVQAAVMEGKFFHMFRQALELVPLPIESIVPESYALAQLAVGYEGVSLLVVRDRESTLLAAVENGVVIAARMQGGDIAIAHIEGFLSFVAARKGRKVARIIFSHFTDEETAPFQKLTADGYELIRDDYNPLIGAALIRRTKGRDEEVLSLDVTLSERTASWWSRLFRRHR